MLPSVGSQSRTRQAAEQQHVLYVEVLTLPLSSESDPFRDSLSRGNPNPVGLRPHQKRICGHRHSERRGRADREKTAVCNPGERRGAALARTRSCPRLEFSFLASRTG